MRRIDERQQVRDAIVSFVRRHGDGTYRMDKRGIAVGAALKRLNPDTATAKDVNDLIGNTSWVCPRACNECGEETWSIVEFGEEQDYESNTARVCGECLSKGAELAASSNVEVRGEE